MCRWLGSISAILEAEPLPTLIAVGDNRRRLHLANQLDLSWITVVHPAAVIDSTVEIGVGVLVLAGAVVQVDAKLGDHVIVNSNATVEHDCFVKTGAHISCNACLAGGALIGEGTLIGVGGLRPPWYSRRVRYRSLGGGPMVVKDLEDHVTAMGVPAKVVETARNPIVYGA